MLSIASSSSLLVKFDEPTNHNGAMVTRYKGKFPFRNSYYLTNCNVNFYLIWTCMFQKIYFLILVEWSSQEDFSSFVGEQIIEDIRYMYYEIPNLVQGDAYYVRVRAWNIRGFSEPCLSNPGYGIPSCKHFFNEQFLLCSNCFHI